MVQILSFLTVLSVSALSLAQSTITSSASYSPDQLSSASSRALHSDASFVLAFLGDFISRSTYLNFMRENSMTYPADLQNYVVRLQSITDDQSLIAALETRSFPFNDFVTMFTKFDWASSFMSEQGVSSFYVPQDFLTANGADASVTQSGSQSSGSPSSSGSFASSTGSSSSGSSGSITSAASSSRSGSSRSGSSSASATSSQSSSSTRSSASNGVDSLYIPIISLPVMFVSLFLL